MITLNEKAIRVRMAELGIDRQKLAAGAGVSYNTLYLALQGGNIKLSTLAEIARVLDVDPRALLVVNGQAPEPAGVAA